VYMDVLITAPDLRRLGGIEQYCRNLQAHLRVHATFLRVGARFQSRSLPVSVLRFVVDTVRFAWQLAWNKPSLVQLNPSLIPRPLIREGAFLLLARARRVPVLVFFH